MPKIPNFDDYIKFNCTKDFKKKLNAVAERRNEDASVYIRRVLEAAISEDSAKDGIDTVANVVRKAVKDTTRGFENRIAAMVHKDTVASATSMNLLLLLLEKMGHDAIGMYDTAQKLAVDYANKRTSQIRDDD